MMKNRQVATILLALLALSSLAIFLRSHSHSLLRESRKTGAMSITHTVLFQFKATAKPDDVAAACTRFLALKDQCLHPTSKTAYITSLKGGKDNSPEGLQNGVTHGFVVEFASVEDRDYYVNTDPSHQAFVRSIGDLVEKAIVVDFTNGVY